MRDAMNLGCWRECPEMRRDMRSMHNTSFDKASASFFYGAATSRGEFATPRFFLPGLHTGRAGQTDCSMQ